MKWIQFAIILLQYLSECKDLNVTLSNLQSGAYVCNQKMIGYSNFANIHKEFQSNFGILSSHRRYLQK